MVPRAGESIYLWMYRQGLSQRPLDEVLCEVVMAGHGIRQKDVRNYWNGWYRHDLYFGDSKTVLGLVPSASALSLSYSDYEKHPYAGLPEFSACFVPCNEENKPLIKWSKGTMSLADAKAWPHCKYLAENMKGAQRIVIDVDGDHGGDLDLDAIRFFYQWHDQTCCHEKPDIVFDWYAEHKDGWAGDLTTALMPISYHLTFGVDRIIPTMHFPKAHVDIVGNKANSLRYFKNKRYNGLPPAMMTNEVWDSIMDWIEQAERR